MKSLASVLTVIAVLAFGSFTLSSAAGSGSETKLDTKGAPFRTIDGKILKIEGEYYVVEDLNGKEFRLHVSKETKYLEGRKKVGDKIRVEITRSGHALSIQ